MHFCMQEVVVVLAADPLVRRILAHLFSFMRVS